MKQIEHHAHTYGMRYHFRHDPAYDVFAFITDMADRGFTGVNLSANGPGYRNLGGTSPERLAAIRDACIERNMTVEIETSDTRVEHLHELIHAAAACGGRCFANVHPLRRTARPDRARHGRRPDPCWSDGG